MIKKIILSFSKVAVLVLALCIFCKSSYSKDIDNQSLKLTYGKHETFDRFVFEFNKKPEYSINSDSYLTTLKLPKDHKIIEKNLNKYPRNGLVEKKLVGNEETFVIPAPIIKTFEYQNKIVIDVKSYNLISDTEKKAPEVIIEENKPADDEITTNPDNSNNDTIENDEASLDIDRVPSLDFEWDKKVGLAVFRRNEYLWVVFNEPKEFDLDIITKNSEGLISEVTQIPNENISIFILKSRHSANFFVKQDGLNWSIELNEQDIENKKDERLTTITKVDKNDYKYLYIPTDSIKNVIMTLDPNSGDVLMIAPVFEPNLGLESGYRYVDFKLLPTVQGMAIEVFTDDIIVNKTNNGLIIGALGRSLNISPDLEELKKQALQEK